MYIKLDGDNNGHLLYDLSRDNIIVTMNHQSVLVPKDLIEPINRTESFNNKNQVDHFNIEQSIV